MNFMKKTFKKYFIPHAENDHKPHFLRGKSVFVTSAIIIVLFLGSLVGSKLVKTNPYLASIQAAFLVDLANDDRADQGLKKLAINDKLVAAASMKAADMSTKKYFAHVSPEGVTPWFWISKAGYDYVYAGENLAVNFSDSDEVEDAWMDSPGHRANILNTKYTDVGIATAQGFYKGNKTTFVVQMFGSARGSVAPKVTPTPKPISKPEPVAAAPLTNDEEVLGEETVATQPVDIVPAASADDQMHEDPYMSTVDPEFTDAEIVNSNSDAPVYTTWYERLIVSPSKVVQDLYIALAAIIIFALVLKIFIEIRLQHPKNIAYGVLLLVLLVVFMHINHTLVSPTVVMAF